MKIVVKIILVLLFAQGSQPQITVLEDKTFEMQQSIAECVLSIAKTYFFEGSIVGIVSDGIKKMTNKKFAVNTNNLIIGKILKEMRWNVLFKRAKTYREHEPVSQEYYLNISCEICGEFH